VAGKKKKYRPKLHINKLHANRKKDEQAATLESANKPLTAIRRISNHSGVWKNSQNRNLLKPVILAVISALVIGSIFGFIMLRMFVTMDASPDLGSNPNPAAAITDDAEERTDNTSDQNTQTAEFESVTAHVLQAGIYSEEENAAAAAENYEKANIPAMIWERDGQYFVFAGVAGSAEQAASVASELETEELELYSKEWSTPQFELSLSQSEAEWLNSFLTWWNQALTSPSSQETEEQLKQLTEKFPNNSNQLVPLYEKLGGINKGNKISDKNLLELWHLYEALGEESR
jgi:stage II sporulation protein B